MSWVLVTGGVCSGIGKGCVAAMVARAVALAGSRAVYRKLEPCLQGSIAALPNTHFGEIVRGPSGVSFDGDVARAAFYVPGFVPDHDSDRSLGGLLGSLLEQTRGEPSPRLAMLDDQLASLAGAATVTIVELGGTAGEVEHRILCDSLHRALGSPVLHVHVTAMVLGPGGRRTTKPAQLSLESLRVPPDLVLVRGAAADDDALAPLRAVIPRRVPVMGLGDDDAWPERAAVQTLASPGAGEVVERGLGLALSPDPLFVIPGADPPADIVIVHDGAGADGYQSLAHRLRAWSRGRIRLRWQMSPEIPPDGRGVIRIGEGSAPRIKSPPGIPVLDIVPADQRRDARDPAHRPDWWGDAAAPTGPVADFVEMVLAARPEAACVTDLAYADEGFASSYLAASEARALRDHEALDDLVSAALPSAARLPGARILDIGCGAGRWAARLVEAGVREVVGVEPAPPMARAAGARRLPRFIVHACPIERYVPEGAFDAVLASMSLDHVEHVAPVLRRIADHLAPRGRVVITTEHPLRTAPLDGARWTEAPDGSRAARVRDYGHEGYRTFHWFGHSAVVRVYHRPASAWLRLLREVGLDLVELHEPVASDPRDAGNPRFWILVAERRMTPTD